MAEKYDAPTRTGLLALLRNSPGSQFVIPVYQRNYTWTTEDVKQYLNDLDCVVKGVYSNHFLGIIIYLEKTISFSSREFSIIDGQQRLTTTFLTLYAIKKLLEKEGNVSDVFTRADIEMNCQATDGCHRIWEVLQTREVPMISISNEKRVP